MYFFLLETNLTKILRKRGGGGKGEKRNEVYVFFGNKSYENLTWKEAVGAKARKTISIAVSPASRME